MSNVKRVSLALLAVIGIAAGCSDRQPSNEKSGDSQRSAARAATIAELASRHSAAADWQDPLKVSDRPGIYTFELQRALVRSDSRPVVLVGTVDDIIGLGGEQYEVRGRQSLALGLPTIYYTLKCAADRLEPLLSRVPSVLDIFDEFAIAASVSRLSKPMFKGSAEVSDDSDLRVPEITIDAGDIVIASGTCLEVVRVGADRPPNKQMEPPRR